MVLKKCQTLWETTREAKIFDHISLNKGCDVGVLRQFMHMPLGWCVSSHCICLESPRKGHIDKQNCHFCVEAYFNLAYTGDRGDRKSTTSYCTYVGEIDYMQFYMFNALIFNDIKP